MRNLYPQGPRTGHEPWEFSTPTVPVRSMTHGGLVPCKHPVRAMTHGNLVLSSVLYGPCPMGILYSQGHPHGPWAVQSPRTASYGPWSMGFCHTVWPMTHGKMSLNGLVRMQSVVQLQVLGPLACRRYNITGRWRVGSWNNLMVSGSLGWRVAA